jgi:hypothetical protein
VKRIGELPRPGEPPRPKPEPAPPPALDQLVDAVKAEVLAIGDGMPPDVAFKVEMLVGLAAQNWDRRAERLQLALTELRKVPR